MDIDSKIQAENDFLNKWAENAPIFMKDGIINPEKYWNSKVKILFLLKEVNGGESGDLRTFLRKGGRKQTWDNVTRWIIGINNLERDIPWKEIDSINEEQRKEALHQIAVVNVKKVPGGHTSVKEQITNAAESNSEMLRQQINMYEPDIIICGGTVGNYFNYISEYDNPVWEQTKHGIGYVVEPSRRIIISYAHPEARVTDCLLYYGLVDAVREILCTK